MTIAPPFNHDHHFIEKALNLARQALWCTSPNPRVGCVIVSAGGVELGQGATQQAGGAHAEVMALRDAAARGVDTRGATAYVTLEPCSHHGRTGPCCDALLNAGISRVVASIADPNPLVSGRGFDRMRSYGVEVQVGIGAEASRELNLGFFSRMVRGTPWVRLKAAASLDGRTALADGQSQWITSSAARADGHAWRARACAILSGVGTVLSDDPRLDVREMETPRQPAVVVLDSALRTPPGAKLFNTQRRVLIYTAVASGMRAAELEARGAELIQMAGPAGRIDLPSVLADLGRREINELHVEAGATLNGTLIAQGLVDEFLFYIAPKLLGSGLGIADLPVLSQLTEAQTLDLLGFEAIGPDLRLRMMPPGRSDF
ncbi:MULTISPECIES: bifunctional diaminohydroxyphosphoribosylaminopyrimidine deaminase/5-amino-6-(5-phosphoribosylamino)uracil reductase RibD [unclassified Acidovorax]|uniref:bifunctional diaminohydroxyphosphoribosylaminopyrimidine deaminase/5-amino-6-(5-phosphoribosylamino)uracil reductase RibD n=1 Tax=unclassified Acidovorax TaxID=2684926 RepID=UPI00288309B9|nr:MULTISPECIES: bifunctional diaminohydroxyphosphoribosylaminopyrimidine deaminase/5-amino-6-(5-phosphoribosylamino)uracil reductase RibD [unclassified Acidovorax]